MGLFLLEEGEMEVVFQKAPSCGPKKHNCPDCLVCQMCSPARCGTCRSGHDRPKPLSVQEQIKRFDELNDDDVTRPDMPLRAI
jgi:hypothetical protein